MGDGEIIERIVSFKKPEISEDRVVMGECEIYGFGGATVGVQTRDVRRGTIYLVDFRMPEGARKFECKIK